MITLFGWKLRILVADDNRETEVFMRNALFAGVRDCIVDVACDGEEALTKMKEQELYDVVILEVLMPQLNGIEVCRVMEYNKRLRDTPVLLVSVLPLSSQAFLDSIDRFDELSPVKGVLEKPFTEDVLIAKVGEIVRASHLNKIFHNAISGNYV